MSLHVQVLWLGCPDCYATWEPASSLSRQLVADFEAGITTQPTIQTTSVYGHVSNIMAVSQMRTDQPQTKKRKEEQPCHRDLEGYVTVNFNFVSNTCTFASTFCRVFEEDNGDQRLNCRTEKDRGVRRNNRTTGMYTPRLFVKPSFH